MLDSGSHSLDSVYMGKHVLGRLGQVLSIRFGLQYALKTPLLLLMLGSCQEEVHTIKDRLDLINMESTGQTIQLRKTGKKETGIKRKCITTMCRYEKGSVLR